jgi:hypothetical protein
MGPLPEFAQNYHERPRHCATTNSADYNLIRLNSAGQHAATLTFLITLPWASKLSEWPLSPEFRILKRSAGSGTRFAFLSAHSACRKGRTMAL